jgi:HEXXH motif-containing protein
MHRGLAQSIEHICEQSRGIVGFDSAAMARLCSELSSEARFPPSTFALYYDLVPALEEGDYDAAQRLFSELAKERPVEASISVQALGEGRSARHAKRYRRMMDSDPAATFEMLPPSPAISNAFRARFEQAMSVLDQAVPELAGELRAIISELVMVVGDDDAEHEFDGGSSYMLWGALFLNAARHPTSIELIEALAHEGAHSLLFGLCTEEPLTENADDERYSSPLRDDPRPLDGIFHATFVLARMHWVLTGLLELQILDSESTAAALHAREQDRSRFEDGYAVLARHARLTETGDAVMASARRYMDSCSG